MSSIFLRDEKKEIRPAFRLSKKGEENDAMTLRLPRGHGEKGGL
ncbi:MAG TPA: hypothetical protein VGJ94_15045 [Syntrophorhabdaceae bacterium]